jgi:hypothetical protein
MGLFGRRQQDAEPSPGRVPDLDPAFADIEEDDGRPRRPTVAPIGEDDLARISTAVAELAADGVDVADLASLGAGYDRAYAAWSATAPGERAGQGEIVARYALGIGEHLNRHTDLDWQVVTDVFGTDLAVAGGVSGSFSVVPSTLVGARWMRGETGWIPAVVGHLVQVRSPR